MLAPAWVCRAVYDIHPKLRLGWVGRPRSEQGQLNAGYFCVVQIYPKAKVGSYDNPRTVFDFWDVETVADDYGNPLTRAAYRGPLFNRNGGTNLDYDPVSEVPVVVQALNESWGFDDPSDVMNGAVIRHIRGRVMRGAERKKRLLSQAMEEGKALDSRISDMAEGMADYWWYLGNKTGETSVDMPMEFARRERPKRYEMFKQGRLSFDDYYAKQQGFVK